MIYKKKIFQKNIVKDELKEKTQINLEKIEIVMSIIILKIFGL